jgi:hypothetical protein
MIGIAGYVSRMLRNTVLEETENSVTGWVVAQE